MDKHVFISYKHEDSDFAENLIHRVENAGFKTWVDSDKLAAGEDWRNGIDESIKNAFALIVIMTPEAKASEYVTYEWAFAWGAGVKVIPVLHKSTQLHPRLEALQHLDFTSRTNRPWDKLFNVLKNAASIASPAVSLTNQNNPSPPYNNHQPTKESWLEKGAIFLERKDYQEALEAYKQAILIDHNDALAYSGRSGALYGLERFKEALDASNQAISLNSNLAEAWNNKGAALYHLERYKDALIAYEQAIHLDPNDSIFWHNKGVAFRGLNRNKDALAAFEQAIHLDPNNVLAWNGKGKALRDLNRNKDALAAFEQALLLDPTDVSAQNSRASLLKFLREMDKS